MKLIDPSGKTNWLMVGIVTALAGVISAGLILLRFQPVEQSPNSVEITKNTPVLKSETEQVDTSSWQTYRNDEFGFELKHPEKLTIIQDLTNSGGEFTYCIPGYEDINHLCKAVIGFEFPSGLKIGMFILQRDKVVAKYGISNNPNVWYDSNRNFQYELVYVNGQGSSEDGKIYDQILATFRFVESRTEDILKPADSQTPAAGACPDSGPGDIAKVVVGMLPPDNVPVPRCLVVSSGQKLQITNSTEKTIGVSLGRVQMTIDPGETQTDSRTFGSYLALGVHNMLVSPSGLNYPGIWLR